MSFRFRESFYCQNHADFVAGMMAQRHRVTAIFIERTAIVKYFGKQSDFVSWHRLPTMPGQSSRSPPVKHPFVSFMRYNLLSKISRCVITITIYRSEINVCSV